MCYLAYMYRIPCQGESAIDLVHVSHADLVSASVHQHPLIGQCETRWNRVPCALDQSCLVSQPSRAHACLILLIGAVLLFYFAAHFIPVEPLLAMRLKRLESRCAFRHRL
jgi:hypothetical protein